jgi:hypothetical protein
MYAINPVNIPLIGQVNTMTVQVNPFAMKPGQAYSVQAYVTLRGSDFYEKNITIPAEIVSVWTDDQVIVDFCISALNVAIGQDLIALAPILIEEPTVPTQEIPAEEPTEPAA